MNCKECRLLVAGLTDDALPDALAAHVESCPACAGLLAVDARLRATLRSHAPAASPTVLARIRAEIPLSPPGKRGWGEGIRRLLAGNTLMKITLPATALLAVALVATLPHSANAATPLATFVKMKRAVLAQAKSPTQIEIHTGRIHDGSIGTWVVVDGELTELGPNGTFHLNKDGKDITIKTLSSTSTNLSSLPPEVRAQVQKEIDAAMSGHGGPGVKTSVVKKYLGPDGKEIDEATALAAMRAQGIEITTSVDLDEGDYSSVAFGADHDHLVLTRKKAKGQRQVVTLDPKTSLPKVVRLERNEKGRWVALRQSNVTLR